VAWFDRGTGTSGDKASKFALQGMLYAVSLLAHAAAMSYERPMTTVTFQPVARSHENIASDATDSWQTCVEEEAHDIQDLHCRNLVGIGGSG
jgi:hypothetical protein